MSSSLSLKGTCQHPIVDHWLVLLLTGKRNADIIHGHSKVQIFAAVAVVILEVSIQVNHEGEISIQRGTLANFELPQSSCV